MFSYKQRYKPRTTREYTKSDLTVYDSADNTALNALTVYGKSEVVDGVIKSAGEGRSVVRLADLTWGIDNRYYASYFIASITNARDLSEALTALTYINVKVFNDMLNTDKSFCILNNTIRIHDETYTTVATFVASLGNSTLCYELADPTQGNAIAVKTNNGTGIDGTMATFTTGTPLYGVDENTRDVMTWDGSAGEVTKVCGEIDLGTLMWGYVTNIDPTWAVFRAQVPNMLIPSQPLDRIKGLLCPLYPIATYTSFSSMENKSMLRYNGYIVIKDNDFTDAETFKSAMNGVKLIYELATPTVTPLTQAENESLANLRTFATTTHFTNNSNTDMTINYTMRVPTIS